MLTKHQAVDRYTQTPDINWFREITCAHLNALGGTEHLSARSIINFESILATVNYSRKITNLRPVF